MFINEQNQIVTNLKLFKKCNKNQLQQNHAFPEKLKECPMESASSGTPTKAHEVSNAPVNSAHLAAGADPLSIRNFGERRVEAVDVVGGGAGITA